MLTIRLNPDGGHSPGVAGRLPLQEKMKRFLTIICALLLGWNGLSAQEIEIDLQVRPRYEYRAGYKSLRSEADKAASFISQRSRLGLGYHEEKLDFRLSLQHAGTWGHDLAASSMVGVFEAYGRYAVNEDVAFKAGRQVLSYDNERIIGELNWTLTGRSHDALLIDLRPGDRHTVHGGLALNSNNESVKREAYRGEYKSMQYLWYHYQVEKFGFSLLFLNVGYEQESKPQEAATQEIAVQNQQTVGAYLKWTDGPLSADGSFYRQSGTRASQTLDAYYAGATFTYKFSRAWAAGAGFDYLSGNEQGTTDDVNRAFFPVFGTNHAFNGHMDYFYVGNHQNSVGLKDFFGKLSVMKGPFSAHLSPHVFYAAADIRSEEQERLDAYLGTEVDLSAACKIDPRITLSMGYSRMFGSSSLERLKGGDHTLGQDWAWLSLSFAPKLFIGK